MQTEILETSFEIEEIECDSETDDNSLFKGNNDEKFIPLVIKQKRDV